MHVMELPTSPVPGLRTLELSSEHEPALQRFFEANPEYFIAVHGEPAGPGEAHEEIHGQLPAGWSFTKKWLVGYVDEGGSLVAMANVITDLLAAHVWHIGLFIVATSRHGTGDAQRLCRGLEEWAVSHGAHWLRLGVVEGNLRAQRFWKSLGYVQVRTRENMTMGKLTNTVCVMVKALDGGRVDEYLCLVPRDRPEPPSAPSDKTPSGSA
jgi:GNAT superfamily N-acetyltransferase